MLDIDLAAPYKYLDEPHTLKIIISGFHDKDTIDFVYSLSKKHFFEFNYNRTKVEDINLIKIFNESEIEEIEKRILRKLGLIISLDILKK